MARKRKGAGINSGKYKHGGKLKIAKGKYKRGQKLKSGGKI
jgi:hypothetical protein